MKQKTRTSYLLISLIILLLFVLAACVRPVPQPEATAVPTMAPAGELPTLVPSTPTPEAAYPGSDGSSQPDPAVLPTADPSQVQPTPSGQIATHTVQDGETLDSIAQLYGVSASEIAAANNLTNANGLTAGQVLVIPAPGTVTIGGETAPPPPPPPATGEVVHVVQPGENLFRISLRYGKTVAEVAAYNGIANPNFIYPGQVIRIPQ
ncbi:MAG: LysM peptidoglycan-binding domain-containing protein [Chloroflexota bacterium]